MCQYCDSWNLPIDEIINSDYFDMIYFINQYPFDVNTISQKNIAYAAQQFELNRYNKAN